jgi:hypothetical protein
MTVLATSCPPDAWRSVQGYVGSCVIGRKKEGFVGLTITEPP